MPTLYELTGKYQEIYDMEDIDSEVWFDTLESVDGEIEDKADGYAKIIAQLKADEAALAEEIKRLQAKKTVIKNKAERLKSALEQAMIATGKTKFKTTLFSFGIQKYPPTVKIDDEAAFLDNPLTENYLSYQEPKIDKKALLNDLKAGIEVEGAQIVQNEGLRIR